MQDQTTEIEKIIDEIVKGINLGNTIIFCGAGISRDSGLPIVNQIVPYILEKFELPEEDIELILDKDHNPKIPFESFIEALLSDSKIDELLTIYDQGEPNTNHFLLAKLIKAGKIKTIVTTNFDKLIEKALGMEPKALMEGKDYDVMYNEQDFEKIDLLDKHIRIIKIHGSIDDKEAMAITIKQVANQNLFKPRDSIIKQVFSKGKHTNVLILGYSSSDLFDIYPQIEAVKENQKQIFYIQHSDNPKAEDINEQAEKNPFKEFKRGHRLYFNTGQLIKILWDTIIDKNDPYEYITSITNWRDNVNRWCQQAVNEYTIDYRYVISASIYLRIGEFLIAERYYKKALKIAKKIGNKQREKLSLGNLGNVYLNLGEYKKAINCYEQSLKMAQEIGDKIVVGSMVGNLGAIYGSKGEHKKAIEYYEQALKIVREIGDKQVEGSFLGNLGNAYLYIGNFKQAIEYYEQALKIVREIGDKQVEGSILGNIGNSHLYLGNLRQAIEYHEQALKIAKEIGDKANEGLWLGNLGGAYRRLGEFRQAIDYYEQALKIVQKIGDKADEGSFLGNLGCAYEDLGEYGKAIGYAEQALKIAKEIGDKQGEGTSLGYLGMGYLNLGENRKAIEYYEQALKIVREIGDKRGEGLWLGNLGGAYGSSREYTKAIEYTEQALKIAQEIGDKQSEGESLGNLGTAYGSLGEYRKAIEYYEQALKIAKEIEDKHGEGLLLGNLGNTYLNLEDYKKAIEYTEQALAILEPMLGSNHPDTKAFKDNLSLARSMVEK